MSKIKFKHDEFLFVCNKCNSVTNSKIYKPICDVCNSEVDIYLAHKNTKSIYKIGDFDQHDADNMVKLMCYNDHA